MFPMSLLTCFNIWLDFVKQRLLTAGPQQSQESGGGIRIGLVGSGSLWSAAARPPWPVRNAAVGCIAIRTDPSHFSNAPEPDQLAFPITAISELKGIVEAFDWWEQVKRPLRAWEATAWFKSFRI
jgi:hypothetical protein